MRLSHLERAWAAWEPEADKTEQDWESDFPYWPQVLDEVSNALAANASVDSADDILMFLSRDHEDERILDLLVSAQGPGEELAILATKHPQKAARWQAAVALGQMATPQALTALAGCLSDPHEYVRRRGLLALREHDATLSEETAIAWLESTYEYSRMVAVDTLAFLRSRHLSAALLKLRDDSSAVVRNRITKLEAQNETVA